MTVSSLPARFGERLIGSRDQFGAIILIGLMLILLGLSVVYLAQ